MRSRPHYGGYYPPPNYGGYGYQSAAYGGYPPPGYGYPPTYGYGGYGEGGGLGGLLSALLGI